jgi:hypothetical protein
MSALRADAVTDHDAGDLYNVANVLARARALAPKLRERSYATNKAGRIPEETIRDFWDSKLNYLLRPKKFGGPAMRPDEAFQVAFELGRGDGSAAWVWSVMLIHDLFVAHSRGPSGRNIGAKTGPLSASSFLPHGKPTPARAASASPANGRSAAASTMPTGSSWRVLRPAAAALRCPISATSWCRKATTRFSTTGT